VTELDGSQCSSLFRNFSSGTVKKQTLARASDCEFRPEDITLVTSRWSRPEIKSTLTLRNSTSITCRPVSDTQCPASPQITCPEPPSLANIALRTTFGHDSSPERCEPASNRTPFKHNGRFTTWEASKSSFSRQVLRLQIP
jgi:hypothetical protein